MYSLVQYDLTATNIEATEQVLYNINEHGAYYLIGALQMAPDGKIYVSIGNIGILNPYISRI